MKMKSPLSIALLLFLLAGALCQGRTQCFGVSQLLLVSVSDQSLCNDFIVVYNAAFAFFRLLRRCGESTNLGLRKVSLNLPRGLTCCCKSNFVVTEGNHDGQTPQFPSCAHHHTKSKCLFDFNTGYILMVESRIQIKCQ